MATCAHSTPGGVRPLASILSSGTHPPIFGIRGVHPAPNGPAEALHQLRHAFYAAGRMLPVDLPDRIALLEQRVRILDLAAALLALADAMDAPAAELEPEPLDDDSEAEASAQPATLCPNRVPMCRVRRAA